MKKKDKPRIIKTGLKGEIAKNICCSIIGQMSDGYWENSPKFEQYWRFVDVKIVKNKITFAVDPRYFIVGPHNKTVHNGFYMMRDSEILGFFAKKIKFILKKELAECYDMKLTKKTSEDKTIKTYWLSYSCGRGFTVSEVEDVIRGLEAAAISAGIAESSVD